MVQKLCNIYHWCRYIPPECQNREQPLDLCLLQDQVYFPDRHTDHSVKDLRVHNCDNNIFYISGAVAGWLTRCLYHILKSWHRPVSARQRKWRISRILGRILIVLIKFQGFLIIFKSALRWLSRARSRTSIKLGNKIATKPAKIAMTTSTSIKVNPCFFSCFGRLLHANCLWAKINRLSRDSWWLVLSERILFLFA